MSKLCGIRIALEAQVLFILLFCVQVLFILKCHRDLFSNLQPIDLAPPIASSVSTKEIIPKIPKRLLLSDKATIFSDIKPEARLTNTLTTIQKYKEAFNYDSDLSDIIDAIDGNKNTTSSFVWYLNNDDCLRLITRVEKSLAEYFVQETEGMYKLDMCRTAALYDKGGYYMDTDMEIIETATVLPPHITFSTAYSLNSGTFFQSFMAVAPKHPILKRTLELFIDHYRGGKKKYPENYGTYALWEGYEEFSRMAEAEIWPIDIGLNEVRGEAFGRRSRSKSNIECNVIVVNTTDGMPQFYSRALGIGPNCPK